jgi:hypothetical protein
MSAVDSTSLGIRVRCGSHEGSAASATENANFCHPYVCYVDPLKDMHDGLCRATGLNRRCWKRKPYNR